MLIRSSYTSSSGTEAQRNAVAQLMYDCGCAVGMNYGSTGSGGSVTTAAQKFHDVFKYAAVNHTNKNYYSDYEWYKLVYDQLKAGCPLIHSGTDKSTNSGHAFIFDGVDKNGMVHVNWGWGSSNHGYFDMLTLTPTNGSTQHNFSTGLGFIYNLKAKPALDEGEEQEYQLVVGRGTGDYKDDYYYICQEDNDIVLYTHGVFNWTPVPFKGYLGVRYENLDGGSLSSSKDNVTKRFESWINKASNAYIRAMKRHALTRAVSPIILYTTQTGVHRMATGTTVKAGVMQINMTSATEELIVPPYEKYIAVKDGSGKITESATVPGNTQLWTLNLTTPGEYTVILSCVDYYGYVVTKKYYITVE